MLYLASNIRPDISFDVHQFSWFTHNTKGSYAAAVKRISWYFQVTKDNSMVFNISKNMVVDFYANAGFAGLWGYENAHDNISAKSKTVFVVTFENYPLL